MKERTKQYERRYFVEAEGDTAKHSGAPEGLFDATPSSPCYLRVSTKSNAGSCSSP